MTYPATVLLGFGFSAMLVNALSFAAEHWRQQSEFTHLNAEERDDD